jgi:hypothetical protein
MSTSAHHRDSNGKRSPTAEDKVLAWTGFVLLTLIGLALTVIGVLDLLKKAGVTIDDKTAIGLMAAGVGIVAIV